MAFRTGRSSILASLLVFGLVGAGCGGEGPAGPAGAAGLACWDLNGNAACDGDEDRDGSGTCDALDCRGAPGEDGEDGTPGDKGDPGQPGDDGLACWDLDGDGECGATEDVDGSGTCDALDCQGADGEPGGDGTPGEDGLACWDLDGDGQCGAGEDVDGSGACDALDCRGADGTPGGDGLACWDLDGDGQCGTAEDKDGSGACDASDCQGTGTGGGCAGNSAPVIAQVTATEETGGFAIAIDASDADNDPLQAELAGSGGALTRDGSDPLLFHFAPTSSGTHTLTAFVTDGCFVAIGSVSVEVSETLDYAWRRVGPGPLSAGDALGSTSMAIRFDGTRPFVAYFDQTTSPQGQVTVSSFDGTSWAPVGGKGLSGSTGFNSGGVGLAVYEGRPYVAYFLQNEQELHLRSHDGAAWSDVATALTPGYVSHLQLDIHNGVPFVAYIANAEYKLYVKRWVNGAWEDVAPALDVPINQPPFGFDAFAGEAYVAYKDADTDSYVVKSGAGAWTTLGGGAFATRSTNSIALKVVASVPYVVSDAGVSSRGQVMTIENGAWAQLGADFSTGQASKVRIDFDGTSPWIAFWDVDTGKSTVLRWTDPTWETIGADTMSPWAGIPGDFRLADGVPYLVFRDNSVQALMCWSYGP